MNRLLELVAAALLAAAAPPTPAPSPGCAGPPAERNAGTVLVYLRREGIGYHRAADPRAYTTRARRLAPSERRAPLRAALRRLLAGPTPRERHLRCEGVRNMAHLLADASIVQGQAIVDFRDSLPYEAGNLFTTTGGAIFTTQLELTIFQFPTVDSIRFEVGGSCRRFFDLMQAGPICYVRERANA